MRQFMIEIDSNAVDAAQIASLLNANALRGTVRPAEKSTGTCAERESAGHCRLSHFIKSMEHVLGIVGHELRTPLASLRAMTELLLTQNDDDDEERQGLLRCIHDQTVGMGELVHNMLEVARLKSGCAQWNWTTVDLAQVSRQTIDLIHPLVDRSLIQLDCDIEPNHLLMRGDRDAIRRLLINLVTNAVKHTEKGRITIVGRQHHEASGKWIELRVSDTGLGMEPDVLDKLGKAFALNSGMVGFSDYITGSGLGLAICKGIIAAHGGTASVHSQRHQGTTFIVRMPADLVEPIVRPDEIDFVREAA